MPSSGFQTSARSEEHTSELQSHSHLVCRLLLEKKNEVACKEWNQVPMEIEGFRGKSYTNACEVASKEWNQFPMEIESFSCNSYDNARAAHSNRVRHVKFIEEKRPQNVL